MRQVTSLSISAFLSRNKDVFSHSTCVSYSGGGVTCICRDTGMCHYFGYFFGGLLPDFWVPFWAIPGFLGIIFWLFPDFRVPFFGKI